MKKFVAVVYFNKGVFKDVPTRKEFKTKEAAQKWVKETTEAYKADKSVSMHGVKASVIIEK